MLMIVATILVMLIVGYAQYRNGLSSSIFMLLAVILSGLVAFNFWEPLADALEPYLQYGTLQGCEDLIVLVLLFSASLLLMRWAINSYLAPEMIEQDGRLQLFGAAGVGLITGYVLSGFLVCVMQTLPLDEKFMDFEPRTEKKNESPVRSFLPPDAIWLTLMRHAGAYPLTWKDGDPAANTAYDRHATFDRLGTFELRYQRYRRNFLPYYGEFDMELYGKARMR